ncbi:MAG: dihydroxyacetone kinase subunit DhaL [Actinomycetota bacterium]
MAEPATSVDAALIRRWIRDAADEIAANRDYLTQLDAAIGDADHGINMDRGFSAVVSDLAAADALGPGELLSRAGSTLVNRVGGAAGPLFGSWLRDAGAAMGDGASVDAEDVLRALRAGLAAVQRLGAAVEGDKTIVDAFVPALAGFEKEVRNGGSLSAAATRAAEAAREGARATIPMEARKGRASYLGPRSVGHQDPGATSTALLFAVFARVAGRSG